MTPAKRGATSKELLDRPQLLPRVMCGIRDDLLAIGSDSYRKLNRLTVFFLVVIRLRADLPVLSTIEMLDNPHLDCLFLVVANPDLECLSRVRLCVLDCVVRAPTLSRNVEGISRVDAHGFIRRSVIDQVLAGELDLAVVVVPVEANPSLRQWHS